MGELIQRKFEQPGDVELVRYSIILRLDLFNLLLLFFFLRRLGIMFYVHRVSSVRGRWHKHTLIRLMRYYKNYPRARRRLDCRC